jgi:hypothetical protein
MLAGCGKHDDAPPAPPPPQAPAWTCEPLPFAGSTPVPEASGAAWTQFQGKSALFVVSDSGNKGAYGLIDPDTGHTLAQGAFGQMDHGDDYEGITARSGRMVVVLSGGYVTEVVQGGDGTFSVGNKLEPLGEEITDEQEPRGNGTRPPKGKGMVCPGLHDSNCGRNFEGICLDDRTPYTRGPCAGFAASKADGHLYCLLEHVHAGTPTTYTADFERSIEVTKPGLLADCAIGEDGVLWAGANVLGANTVYRIDHWEDPSHANVVEIGPVGIGNSEVLAVRGDVVYRMSDTNGSPSLMSKFRCRPRSQ